jgi:hypothetical protein
MRSNRDEAGSAGALDPTGPAHTADWIPDHWLIITRRWFRWHWELRNLVGYCWASGTAQTFVAAREAGVVRAKIGPTRPLPTRPDPGVPEAWPRVNYLPLRERQ